MKRWTKMLAMSGVAFGLTVGAASATTMAFGPGNDDATNGGPAVTVEAGDQDQVRLLDQDRDRDRIHQTVTTSTTTSAPAPSSAVLDAGDRDRDRDGTCDGDQVRAQDRDRDRLHDGSDLANDSAHERSSLGMRQQQRHEELHGS